MEISRREFLKYVLIGGGALLAGYTLLKYALPKREEIERPKSEEPAVIPRDIEPSTSTYLEGNEKILVSKVQAKENVKESILTSVDLVGGFEKFINPGDSVLLKPNYNSADLPPASSDPRFVKSVIELLYEHGASRVVVGESSGIASPPTREVMERTGIIKAAQEAGAEVHIFDEMEFVEIELPGIYLKKVNIAKDIYEFDKIVYTPCMKTHQAAQFTLSLKLAVGFMRQSQRYDLHASSLEKKIADLNLAVNPNLIIMDGRKCFIMGGPAYGELREPNVILASADRIAIDVEALKVIQSFEGSTLTKNPWEYPQIQRAVELNLGATSERDYRIMVV